MPITLNPACPLCGMRFGNQPLLDLHIREDHRRPVFGERSERSGDDDPGSTGAPAPEAAEATPARCNGLSRFLRIFRLAAARPSTSVSPRAAASRDEMRAAAITTAARIVAPNAGHPRSAPR